MSVELEDLKKFYNEVLEVRNGMRREASRLNCGSLVQAALHRHADALDRILNSRPESYRYPAKWVSCQNPPDDK